MKFTSEKQLRENVRNQLKILLKESSSMMNEAGDDPNLTNAEMTKGLKTNAADIAAEVPAMLNARFIEALNALKAMSKHDRTNFEKIVTLAIKYSQNAQKKMKK